MKKLLFTFLIPTYNGEKLLDTAIHSLISERLIEKKLVDFYEVIIVNDGSKDNTAQKAADIAKEWNGKIRKNFIKVINKENGQYGSVINVGLKAAEGIYFKVLDCDDTLHTTSLIETIFILMSLPKKVDLVLTDFTMEKVGSNEKILNSLRQYFLPYKILNLEHQDFPNDLMTMHSYIYRTNFLREIKYQQVEKVYYSDSQYALIPLTKAQTMYYINVPLYRYYIGRHEQSINLKTMIKNRKQQLVVFHTIFNEINFKNIKSPTIKKYTYTTLRRMVQWQVLLISLDKKIKNKRKAILGIMKEVKKLQPTHYRKILGGSLFLVIKTTRAFASSQIIKIGVYLYSRFKKNILAEWD